MRALMRTFVPTIVLVLLLAAFPAVVAWSQEEGGDTGPDPEASVDTEDEEVSADTPEDDSDLDEQGFESTDDDDFVPSEEIPTDQSIAFPTDI